MAITVSRASEAYNLKYEIQGENVPVRENIIRSPFAHLNLQPLASPYSDWTGVADGDAGFNTEVYDLAEILARMQNLSDQYPNDIVYDFMGLSYAGHKMGVIRVNDDNSRPIVMMSIGPHGNEVLMARAILDFAELFVTSSDPVISEARQRLAFVVFVYNPDGTFRSLGGDPDLDGRNNNNNVNLNRQWPNYWDRVPDTDKGSTYLSEPESQNIVNWLGFSNRAQRIVAYFEPHGWESRTQWGFLTEWDLYNIRSMRTVHGCYLYCRHLLSKRDVSAFTVTQKLTFTGATGTIARGDTIKGDTSAVTAEYRGNDGKNNVAILRSASGTFTVGETIYVGASLALATWSATVATANTTNQPVMTLFNSKMKPYLSQYIWALTQHPAYCGLLEYPEHETSAGLIMTTAYDFCKGILAGAVDAVVTEESGYLVTPAVGRPLNNNWDMVDWESASDRPSWMRFNGLTLTHYPTGITGDSTPFLRIQRPTTSAWPSQRSRCGYEQPYKLAVTYDNLTVPFTVGKKVTGGTSGATGWIVQDSAGILDVALYDGIFVDNESITDTAGGSALVNVAPKVKTDTAFYIVGGRSSSGALDTGHKENFHTYAQNATSALPGIRQYGALTFDGTYFYFVGGHTGTTYQNEIYQALASDEATVPPSGSGYTLWHTLYTTPWSNGIQRHTAHIWVDPATDTKYLLIVGGRDTSDYINAVLKINISTKVESQMTSTLGVKRGYHTSCVWKDNLYIFGGWAGATVQSRVDKIDLVNDTRSSITALPAARRRQALALDRENGKAYLAFGQSGTDDTDLATEIYCYNLNNDTVTTVNYERDGDETDHDGFVYIEEPKIQDAAAFVHVGDSGEDDDNLLMVVGGVDEAGVHRDTVYELDIGGF